VQNNLIQSCETSHTHTAKASKHALTRACTHTLIELLDGEKASVHARVCVRTRLDEYIVKRFSNKRMLVWVLICILVDEVCHYNVRAHTHAYMYVLLSLFFQHNTTTRSSVLYSWKKGEIERQLQQQQQQRVFRLTHKNTANYFSEYKTCFF